MPTNEYIDLENALQRLRGDKNTLKMLINMFLEGNTVSLLETALNQQDYKVAEEHSHALKGIAGNLSLTLLCNAVTRLNNELKQGSLSSQAVEEYYTVVRETIGALNDITSTL